VAKVGANRFRLTHVAGRTLPAGRYRVTVVATGPTGKRTRGTARFRVSDR
jgi:hypothetical protein